jgi:ABC-type lipoprotein release transport system permease subunit
MFKLSWRNIWRNKRRSIITIASVFFAVFFCTAMLSINEGIWDKMIENTLRTQTGHIQIHQKGYWDEKVIDNFMTLDSTAIAKIEKTDNIENVSPRIEVFAMASYGTLSKGVAVIGVSPEKEAEKSNLSGRIAKGNYLTEHDSGIIIGEGLAKYLKVDVGDTLALIGQGYHGASAVGLFPIRGILQMFTTDMDNGITYMSLTAAQNFIDMPNGYSGILISIKNEKKLNETLKNVQAELQKLATTTPEAANLDVYSWHFTMEKLLQTAEADKAFGKLMMYILYLIVGFGILGTVIMMTNERRREFAIMISLGMNRRKLNAIIALELTMLSLAGVVAALMITVPLLHFFAVNPIQITGEMAKMYEDMGMEAVMPTATDAMIFIKQIITIAVFACITLIYPIRVIKKLKITEYK